ncbi:MAG: muconate cycloisomerase [Acidobacteria bacterium]|nr:muconate cycloisomerase [Acidobacteriota bacterium]MBI3469750.1 muconate cycloisomerase [Candidatus Solibacter usitatus]
MTQRRSFLKTALLGAAPLAAADRAKLPVIRKVEVLPTSVLFQHTFVIGRGQVGAAGQGGRYVYVRVESEDGRVGWGETNTVPSWSYETLESVVSTIRNYLAPIVMNRSPFEQVYFQKQFDERLTPAVSQGFPFAKSAILTATLDLCGQITGQPMHQFFGGRVRDKIELCYALSIDAPKVMAEVAASYPYVKCFKLKVAGDEVVDTQRVKAVAEARPDCDIWLDANQSYRPIHMETFLKKIDGMLQVRCLEQPVKSVDWFGLKRVRDKTPLPIALDEGCFNSYDVARLARMEAGDLVVLKVAKAGGLWGCQRSAVVAEANGLGLLGSGLTESGIGLVAALHLYSTLDLLLPPELNGPEFLADLMVDGLRIDGCTVTLPDAPGLGVRVKEDKIRANPIPV